MMRSYPVVLIAVFCLCLAGCPLLKPPIRVGMVVNMPIAESRFNATAWHGLERARDSLGAVVELYTNEDFANYEPGIQHFIDNDFDMILTVGFPGVEATEAAAEAHPDVTFVCVDHRCNSSRQNLAGADFDTGQAAFLAGYLAAGMTRNGTVGVMGGMDIPPVAAFMDGLADGVAHFNTQHETSVNVIGETTFVGSFDDIANTRSLAQAQIDAGADILMAASGDGARGAAAAVLDTPGALYIGVDIDWYLGQPQYSSVMLTSIMKHLDVAVLEMVTRVDKGVFDGSDYIGTLANDGIGLAPFHDVDDAVPDQLKQELETLRSHFGPEKRCQASRCRLVPRLLSTFLNGR